MITKITGESPFQVMAETFCISPSNEGYTIQFSADGTSYTDLIAVEAGVNKTVSEQAVGTYYKLVGNASEITVTSGMDCNTGGGGGGGSYTLPKASSTTLGGVKIGDGISIDTDGKISASGGGGSLSYKYIIPATDSEKVDDTFIAAIEACGGDNLKLAELARNVALKVELNEGQGYTYFPAVDSHFWYDNALFMCEGMNAQYFRGVYYKNVTYTGDNKGTVGTFLNDTNFGDITSVKTAVYVIDGDSLTDEMKASIDEMWTRINDGDNQFTVTAKYDYTYYPAGFPVKYEYTESTPDTPTEYLHQYGVKFWSTKLNENDTAEKKIVKIFHYEGRDGDGYSVEISTSW